MSDMHFVVRHNDKAIELWYKSDKIFSSSYASDQRVVKAIETWKEEVYATYARR